MVKVIALGKKRNTMSHEECVKHHREVHAPMAAGLLGPVLKKYIAYYVDEAFSLVGGVIPRPFDLGIIEWLGGELKDIEPWRKTPDGMKITEDEEYFTDTKHAILLLCQENVIVSPREGNAGVTVLWLGRKRGDISHEDFVKHHRDVHAPMAARILGHLFKNYTAYYVDEAFSLVGGPMPTRPYDAIVITRFNNEYWKEMEAWRKTSEGINITEDEERFMDRENTIAMVCQENVIIP